MVWYVYKYNMRENSFYTHTTHIYRNQHQWYYCIFHRWMEKRARGSLLKKIYWRWKFLRQINAKYVIMKIVWAKSLSYLIDAIGVRERGSFWGITRSGFWFVFLTLSQNHSIIRWFSQTPRRCIKNISKFHHQFGPDAY